MKKQYATIKLNFEFLPIYVELEEKPYKDKLISICEWLREKKKIQITDGSFEIIKID